MAESKSSRTVEARKRSRKPKELQADRSPLLAVQASREDDPHPSSVQDRARLTPQQTGFRPGKSCCSQVLNLTQHIEDGFELGQITGAEFIDLTAAYDTINHRRLLVKLVMLTDDVPLTKFIRTMLSNRRFKVELNGKQSRWRNQRNGLFAIFNAIPYVVQYVHQRPATHSCHQQFHLSRRPVPYHPTPSPAD